MPTPAKPISVIKLEGKSHRTKKEIAMRERAEASLLTGKPLRESREVRDNPRAHAEFRRLLKLLKSINKNDDLYGATINRYCMICAECIDFQERAEKIRGQLDRLDDVREDFENQAEYYKIVSSLQNALIAIDRQLQTKRKMLLDVEKENIMTIASSLRTIPKTQDKKKNALKEALSLGS